MSKAKARPFDLSWARSLRDQCRAAGVPFFLKQLGSDPHAWKASHEYPTDGSVLPLTPGTINDSHGGNPEEWPEDLQGCREFPKVEV